MKKIATLLLVAASTLASVKTANAQQKLNRGYSLNEAEAKIYLAKFGK